MLVSQEPVIRREFLRANDTTENVFVLLVLNDEQSVAFKFETKEERENYLAFYRSQGKTAVVVLLLTWKQAQEWIECIADTCGKPEESAFIRQNWKTYVSISERFPQYIRAAAVVEYDVGKSSQRCVVYKLIDPVGEIAQEDRG